MAAALARRFRSFRSAISLANETNRANETAKLRRAAPLFDAMIDGLWASAYFCKKAGAQLFANEIRQVTASAARGERIGSDAAARW
jgi:hypothetical protein